MLGTVRPHRIDVHHHFLAPGYVAEVSKEILASFPYGMTDPLEWTPGRSLEEMDRAGVAAAVLSVTAPGIWFGDRQQSRRLARICNEYAASIVRDYAERFGFFAAIALPDVEGSLQEIEYALDVLHADGIGLLSSYGNRWPGDPAFAPVFQELNRRKAVVYVHPLTPACCGDLIPDVPDAMIEFPFDTTRSVASLLYSGTFSRCADIRFIFSHGGGAVPMLADRMMFPERMQKNLAARLPRGADYEIRKLYFDTASVVNVPAFAALSALVPASQILFGSDYPFLPISATVMPLQRLGLASEDLKRIECDNALTLIPSLHVKRLRPS